MIKAIIFDFGNVNCTFYNDLFIAKISEHTPKSAEELSDLIYHKSRLPILYETRIISSDEFFARTVNLCELDLSKELFIQAYVNIFTPINYTADSTNFKGVTLNKVCSGLTGKCLEMPTLHTPTATCIVKGLT